MNAMAVLRDHGMLLQSARGPIHNGAELVAGERIKGSWWAHPKSHDIFAALGVFDASPDVVRMRLVNGKVTLVHRDLWPALVRVADRFTAKQLATLHEEHTATGAHKVEEEQFPDWVTDDVRRASEHLSVEEALARLPACLRGS